jgi:hypothetical protein
VTYQPQPSDGPAGRRAAPQVSDEAIRAIARQIRAGIARRPPDPLSDSILSRKYELSHEDEERVIAALLALRTDPPDPGR